MQQSYKVFMMYVSAFAPVISIEPTLQITLRDLEYLKIVIVRNHSYEDSFPTFT